MTGWEPGPSLEALQPVPATSAHYARANAHAGHHPGLRRNCRQTPRDRGRPPGDNPEATLRRRVCKPGWSDARVTRRRRSRHRQSAGRHRLHPTCAADNRRPRPSWSVRDTGRDHERDAQMVRKRAESPGGGRPATSSGPHQLAPRTRRARPTRVAAPSVLDISARGPTPRVHGRAQLPTTTRTGAR